MDVELAGLLIACICSVLPAAAQPTYHYPPIMCGAGVEPEWAKAPLQRDKSKVVFRAAQMDQQAVAELQRRLEQSESDCARMERQLQQLRGKGVRPGLLHDSTSQSDSSATARSAGDGHVWQESQELLQATRRECQELEWQVHRLQGQLMDVGQGHEARSAAGEPGLLWICLHAASEESLVASLPNCRPSTACLEIAARKRLHSTCCGIQACSMV